MPNPVILPDWRVHKGTGPHLLLVHGFLTSRSQWLLNLDHLSSVCQPVTVELFGHHESPSPADPACFAPEYYVRAFEQIRQTIGAERWFVLGYSLGAGLTLRYALEHPERILGHLFTNSTSGLADSARQAEFQAGAGEMAAKIRAGGQAAMARIPVHPKHGWKLPKPVYDALVADSETHDPDGIANTIAITNPAVSMRARLVENARPACLIWGVKEKRFRSMAKYAALNMPQLTTINIEAGHGMNMEDPESFNRAVVEFIDQSLKGA